MLVHGKKMFAHLSKIMKIPNKKCWLTLGQPEILIIWKTKLSCRGKLRVHQPEKMCENIHYRLTIFITWFPNKRKKIFTSG